MICGVTYNVFNGEEHLISSLAAVRRHIQHISLVVQRVSNVGNPAGPHLEQVVEEAARGGLADEIIWFEPDLDQPPVANELAKRNLGLSAARTAGVTHFMTMDCDEYYVGSELELAKQYILEFELEATAVTTYLHVKRPIWRSRQPDTTCCSFLSTIAGVDALEYGSPYPALVDPTRRVNGQAKRFHMFAPDEVSMRHMNLVRHDLRSKLANSSNASATDFMRQVQTAYDAWEFGELFHFPNKPPMEIVQVDDLFGIDHLFSAD